MSSRLIDDPVANFSTVPVSLNDAGRQGYSTRLTGDLTSRHFQEELTTTHFRSQTHTLELAPCAGRTQHPEIALLKEFRRDPLAGGGGSHLVADRSGLFVERDVIDRREGGDVYPAIPTAEPVNLKLREFELCRLRDPVCCANTQDVEPMRGYRRRRHAKLVGKVSTAGAVVAIAIGIRDADAHRPQQGHDHENEDPHIWSAVAASITF
jgi:hypothetical protein